ncbi:phage integrase SAM-like domain-containing protein [Lacibacter sediminis]|uniref:Phage integrase SAM-like domain-containing protein n=1 Tax=Lacibacter sediminis TaxID=2760713 RepID=A0A7G5XLV3_9BACT|nr:phage integrase SAM-like domain-containing protein [Lacibacter sediminis]QNA46456.1 phage integrase SAM-like domain-containing protein [Lacibacter sediminis]
MKQEAGRGTPRNFTTAYNILKGFLVKEKLLKIKLTDFDRTVFVKFHESMTDRNRLPKPMKPNSAGSVVKKLRPAFNRAVLLKLISENPTYGTKITTKSKQKPRLDISELKRIYVLDCSDNYSLNLAKNVFLLCCFTGFSIKDVMSLKKSMLLKRDDGEVLIRKRREKSDEEVLIFLHKFSKSILNEFAELPEMCNADNLVPNRVGEYVNRQLKIIGAKANIPFNLSTNIGRHSFRQLIRESGIRDMATIKKMMGHAPPRDIDSVYDFVTSKDLFEAKSKFETFLTENILE